MMYDDELQNINSYFSGQEKSKKCKTCKKSPDWYYCGEYLGALDVYTGEHYEDIFEKINDLVSTLISITTVTLNNESFLEIGCGNEENITVEYESGAQVEEVTTNGNTIVVPDNTIIDVTINGITVADDAVSDVALTLVDQNGDDVPFTQTGTELEVTVGGGGLFDLEIKVDGVLKETIPLDSQENNTININA